MNTKALILISILLLPFTAGAGTVADCRAKGLTSACLLAGEYGDVLASLLSGNSALLRGTLTVTRPGGASETHPAYLEHLAGRGEYLDVAMPATVIAVDEDVDAKGCPQISVNDIYNGSVSYCSGSLSTTEFELSARAGFVKKQISCAGSTYELDLKQVDVRTNAEFLAALHLWVKDQMDQARVINPFLDDVAAYLAATTLRADGSLATSLSVGTVNPAARCDRRHHPVNDFALDFTLGPQGQTAIQSATQQRCGVTQTYP